MINNVEKLKIFLSSNFDHKSFNVIEKLSEFIIKIVGAEEYILYDNDNDNDKLIVDYEAVRKTVRNEDDVIFQLNKLLLIHHTEYIYTKSHW